MRIALDHDPGFRETTTRSEDAVATVYGVGFVASGTMLRNGEGEGRCLLA